MDDRSKGETNAHNCASDEGLDVLKCSKKSIKSTARMRWNILSNALNPSLSTDHKNESQLGSKRLFSSFGLIDMKDKRMANNESYNDCNAKWFECRFGYDTNESNERTVFDIRLLTEKMAIHELSNSLDNTGNVCLWPTEEVLAYYCFKNRELCSDKTVLELGGGMTCLCGLVSAVFTSAKEVILTDGNERCVENIKEIVKQNSNRFNETIVRYKQLKWGNDSHINDLLNKVDVIFCSDCLYFDDSRHLLVDTIFKLLTDSGVAVILAPTRGTSLNNFVDIAKEKLETKRITIYDNKVWRLHNHFVNTLKPPHYVTDLHFPVMITLRKPSLNH